jgi:TctA family transporter
LHRSNNNKAVIMPNGNYFIFFNRPIALGLLLACTVLLTMSAVTFLLKRKDWRDKLAEAETGEVQQ